MGQVVVTRFHHALVSVVLAIGDHTGIWDSWLPELSALADFVYVSAGISIVIDSSSSERVIFQELINIIWVNLVCFKLVLV